MTRYFVSKEFTHDSGRSAYHENGAIDEGIIQDVNDPIVDDDFMEITLEIARIWAELPASAETSYKIRAGTAVLKEGIFAGEVGIEGDSFGDTFDIPRKLYDNVAES